MSDRRLYPSAKMSRPPDSQHGIEASCVVGALRASESERIVSRSRMPGRAVVRSSLSFRAPVVFYDFPVMHNKDYMFHAPDVVQRIGRHTDDVGNLARLDCSYLA